MEAKEVDAFASFRYTVYGISDFMRGGTGGRPAPAKQKGKSDDRRSKDKGNRDWGRCYSLRYRVGCDILLYSVPECGNRVISAAVCCAVGNDLLGPGQYADQEAVSRRKSAHGDCNGGRILHRTAS